MFEIKSYVPSAKFCVWITLFVLMVGCQPKSDPSDRVETNLPPSVSTIPLRLWIAAPIEDVSAIRRQWMANSDQKVDITAIDVSQLLSAQECNCDVLLFPSRLMGELVRRKWIARLPTSVLDQTSTSDDRMPTSAAARAQTLYNGEEFAVSLGCAVHSVISSDSMRKNLGSEPVSWQRIVSELSQGAVSDSMDEVAVDQSALIDRFLAILASHTERNSRFGLLFEMQTMQPRLTEPEFVETAKVLMALAKQPGGEISVLGSHDVAWKWASESSEPRIAIASPLLISIQSAAIKTGRTVRISSEKSAKGWNGGGGLLASLSTGCQQTSHAREMLRWLQFRKTRSAVAPLVAGIASPTPVAGSDALGWIAQQQLSEALASTALPQEPSLPFSREYRIALATELVHYLTGKKTVKNALSDADRAWSEITSKAGLENQRTSYEKSLGLTL